MKKDSWGLKDHRLFATIVFLNGAVIMSIEIVGARTIAPYFGTSTYVWTAVIGVLLGALAAGYWQGGILADKSASFKGLQKIFLVAASLLALTTLLQTGALSFIAENIPSLRFQAALASAVLFAPTTFYLGMVSPYVAKLALVKLKQSGEIIGKLYALGTFGSIAGTFLTGYYLINYVGNRQLYWIFVISLILLAIISNNPMKMLGSSKKLAFLVFLGILIAVLASYRDNYGVNTVFAKDTAYASYRVEDRYYTGQLTRLLITDNNGAQSGIFINDPLTPPFPYIKSLVGVVENHEKTPQNILMIGGGAYTLPTILHDKYPDMQIDVVEIDQALDQVAVDHFNFKPSDKIKIIHEDGRAFLNRNTEKYDLVILDAYNSLRPPFHLMTLEAVRAIENSLKSGGVIASNVIGSLEQERAEFASSVAKTFREELSGVEIFFTNERPADQQQNLLFLASNDINKLTEVSKNFKSAKLGAKGLVLSDNFAPTERLLGDF